MKYLMILFLISFTMFADDHKKYYDHDRERHINKELSHLNLSKEQNTKVKKILKEFRFDLKEFRELKENIEQKRKDIFTKELFDATALKKLNSELDARSHDIENRFLKSMHSILTKQQREDFIYYFDDWEVD